MAKAPSPIVVILGQDSLRADRALAATLQARGIEASDIVRLWGDESSFGDVFAAANSRSLFSERTVVLVRRAEKLRGGGRDPDDDDGEEAAAESGAARTDAPARARGAPKAPAPTSGLPDLDPSSSLIFMVRKTDRRFGLWKKISKVADIIDAEYLKGKALHQAAAGEARTLGLRVPDDLLRDLVEQSGPALGRVASELEKMLLYQGAAGRGTGDGVAVTSSPPLYLLSDALLLKDRKRSLGLLDEALRQGEAGLRVLAAMHGTIRKLAMFRALRKSGVSSTEAGAQLGVLPFKIAETDRAARSWSDRDIGRALSVFAEADRRLKLSAPTAPVLTHAVVTLATGGRA